MLGGVFASLGLEKFGTVITYVGIALTGLGTVITVLGAIIPKVADVAKQKGIEV
jgi:hypothetical protein